MATAISRTEENRLVQRYLNSAMVWLIVSVFAGLIVAVKFVYPDFLGGIPWLQFSRVRMVHTNGVAFGWIVTAFIGLTFYVIPRACGAPLFSIWLGRLTLAVWNIIIAAAAITLALGMNKGYEYAETITPISILVTIGVVLVIVNVFGTVARRADRQLYVSTWYISASLLWTAVIYMIGNFLVLATTGINAINLSWYYVHNLVGLIVTPWALGIVYYILPVAAKRPIYSHALSLIGFWTIAFTYSWTGAHHGIYSPLPYWLQTVSIVFSWMLVIPVFAVVTNFFGTLKGQWRLMVENPAVKFIITGTVFYMLTCLQGPTQALRSVSQISHFTDWTVGHAHMALYGTFSFFAFGAMYHVVPKISGNRLYSLAFATWHFWLSIVGFTAYAFALWAGGLIEGFYWRTSLPFVESVIVMEPFWVTRVFGGILMIAGILLFAANMLLTSRSAPLATSVLPAGGRA